jgi:hypothetical protein
MILIVFIFYFITIFLLIANVSPKYHVNPGAVNKNLPSSWNENSPRIKTNTSKVH